MHSRARFETIKGDELYRRLALGKSVIVLDVRAPAEFAEGHIPGSLLIPLQELEARGLDDKFHPSSIEVHPETGALILVAARQEAMVELSSEGEILATRELKRKDHPQPEGLAFLPDGSLILADEGQGKRGTITRYTPRGGDER